MPETLPTPLSNKTLFERGLRHVLRPIAKAMIAHGLPLASGVAILKEVMVDVASEDIAQGKLPSDSQITAMTGVHRKDVRMIRAHHQAQTLDKKTGVVGNVIGRWLGNRRYLDQDGRPLPLPRLRQKENQPSFAALVEDVSNDVRPAAVIDAMITQDLVEIDERNDRVLLKAEAYIPGIDRSHLYDFWGKNLEDHALAATANILAKEGDPLFFERAVFYHQLTGVSVAELNAKARKDGMDLLQALNKRASALQDEDQGQPRAHHRFRFGMFFYSEPETPSSSAKTIDQFPQKAPNDASR